MWSVSEPAYSSFEFEVARPHQGALHDYLSPPAASCLPCRVAVPTHAAIDRVRTQYTDPLKSLKPYRQRVPDPPSAPRAAGQHGGRMPSVPHVQHLAGKRMSSAFHWCTVHRCQTKIFVRGGRTNPTVPQNRIGIPTGKGDMVSFGGVTVEF